jgi:type I restriction enzyme S subunit
MTKTEQPKNWKTVRLEKLVKIDQSSLGSKTDPDYQFKYVSLSDVDKGVISSELSNVMFKDAPSRARRIVKKGDILFSTVRPNLEGYARINLDVKDLIASTGFAVLSPKELSDTEFIYQYLYSYHIKKQIYALVVGSNYPAVNSSDVAHLKFNIPNNADERKAIADLLSTWDSAIEKTERLIAAKEKRFQWLLDELINQNPDKANWKAHAFNSIFKQQRNKHTGEGQCEILSVTKDGIVLQSEYFNKEIASEDLTGYLIVDRDEFVMSGLNFWMGSVDFQTIVDRGLVSPAYKVYKVVSKSIDMDFLKIFVRSTSMTNLLVSVSVQGASIVRRNLDKEMLENSVIKAPSLSKQKEIAGIIISAQKEIDLLKTLAKKYKQQKRGLMQKLLTGEWRVKVA